jgi:hypothetical protein
LKVEVLVLHDDRPVEGAMVAGVRVFYSDGKPASITKRVIGRASRPLSANKPTSADGSTEANLTFPGDPTDDTPLSFGAFHPENGSGYAERTLGEIEREGPVVIELGTGEVVMGRVIDEAGNPVRGAGVELGATWHRDSPSVDGVEVLSKADGSFHIPGIRFGNVPTRLRVWYEDPDPRFAEMQHARRVPTARREALVKISEENRRDDGKTWDVGDVVIKEDLEFKKRLSEVRQKWSRGDVSPGRVGVNKTGSETGDK